MNAGGSALVGAFAAGLVHPLTVPAHLVAMLGLALVIGQQSQRRATVFAFALFAFALGLIGGLAALTTGVGETSANTVLLAAAGIAGLMAAAGWPMPAIVAAPLALVIGASIGLDSPPRATSVQAANAMLIGTAAGALLTVAVIAAIAVRLRRGWPRIGMQVLGAWITASAILVIALRFAR